MPEPNTSTAVMDAPVSGPPPTGDVPSTTLRQDESDDGFSVDQLYSGSINATPTTQQEETAPEVVEEPAPAAVEPVKAAPDNRLEQLIQEHAKKLGLDANNPAYKGILKQLADKDLFIEELQAKAGGAAAPAPDAPVADQYLTDFERKLLEAEAPKQETAPQTAAAAQPGQGLPQFGDVGDQWKDETDAYRAEAEAWAKDDFAQVAKVRNAVSVRQIVAMVPQLVMGILQNQDVSNRVLSTGLGPEFVGEIVPELRSALESKRAAEDRDFSINELKANENFKDLDALFKAEEGAKPLSFEGEKFPNNPLNRIMIENPWIFSIGPRAGMKDARAAARLGMMDRYRAAYQIYTKEQAAKKSIDPSQATAIMQAGAETERRAQQDRTRQGLNSGSGATTANGQKPRAESYVQEIQRVSRGDSLSINDL